MLRAKKANRVNKRQVSPVAISENEMDTQDSNYVEKVAENTALEDIFKVLLQNSSYLQFSMIAVVNLKNRSSSNSELFCIQSGNWETFKTSSKEARGEKDRIMETFTKDHR